MTAYFNRSKIFLYSCILLALTIAVRPALRNWWHNHNNTLPFLEISGKGPPIVLLHGLSGSHRYWQEVVSHYQSRYELYAFDLKGFGNSPWPRQGYSLQDQVKFIEPYLPQQNFILLGHSLGSLVAVGIAEKLKDRIDRLILLAPPIVKSRQELREILRQKSSLESIMALDKIWAPLICHIHEILGPLSYYFYRPFIASYMPDKLVFDATLHRWESYDHSLDQVVIGFDFSTKLQAVTAKVDVLYGSNDLYTADIEQYNVKAHAVVGGHNFLWENPKDTLATLDRLLFSDH